MSMQTVTVTVHVRWWLKLYLHSVAAWAALFDMEPDLQKVERMIRRGLVIEAGNP